MEPSQENPLLGGVARSDGGRGAPGWVCSRLKEPTQGLAALAPPKRGFNRLRHAAARHEDSCTRRLLAIGFIIAFAILPTQPARESTNDLRSFPSGSFPSRRPYPAHKLRNSSLSWVNTLTGWNETSRPRLVFLSQMHTRVKSINLESLWCGIPGSWF